MSKKTNNLYEFGEFRLDTEEKVLYRNERLLSLAPKVLDTLEVLVKSGGKLLSKEDLMDAVWQDSFVEESNLTQNIYTLRQVFGKRNKFIKTVPRRGYRFSVEVREISRPDESGKNDSADDSVGVLIAQRSRTHIIEEEILEDDGESAGIPAEAAQKRPIYSSRVYLGVLAVVLAVATLGLFGFTFLNKTSPKMTDAPVGRAQFKGLTDTGEVSALAVSPNNRFLAYTVNSPVGDRQMRLKDLELNQDVSLDISIKANPTFLRFSPDGNYLFFLSGQRSAGSSDLYKMTRFGGDPELIAPDIAGEFSFSGDGGKIIFIRNDEKTNTHTLFIKDLEKGEEREILKKNFPEGFSLISSPAFSPGGEKIYVLTSKQKTFSSEVVSIDLKNSEETIIRTPEQLKHFIQIEATPVENEVIVAARRNGGFGQIYKLSTTDGTVRPITNDLNYYRKISVSADGKSISALKIQNYSNLWLLPDAEPENARQLTKGTFGRDGKNGLELLPDGKIAFVSIASGNREIWTLDLRDDSRNQLTKHEREVSQNPVVAPNGRHIYYVSGRNRSRSISRMDFNGQNQVLVTSDMNSNDLFPAVSPDEKKLFFIRQTSGKSAIMQMDLPDGEPQKLDLPDEIVPGGFLNISPDGRLLAFRPSGNNEEEDESKSLTIGIISLDGSFSGPKFFNVKAFQQVIRWTPAGDAFDFIQTEGNASLIKRLKISAEGAPETVAEIKGMIIHNFIWMPNQKDLLISDQNRKQDAVLIRNFQ